MPLGIKVAKIQYVDGGMKILNENDKKPFYKRNWFWITILSIFVIVSATTYVANFAYSKDKADQSTVKQESNQSQKKIEKNPSLVAKYNSIKNGFTRDETVKVLGNPTVSENLDTENGLTNLTWTGFNGNNEVTIQINFEKNKVTSKSIQGLNIDRKKLLTMADYNKLQNGDSYNRVVSTLGDPDSYSELNGVRTLTYMSDLAELDPTQAVNIQIKLSNGQIIAKSQVNLK